MTRRWLADAFPAITLGEPGRDGKRRSWIMYMPLGEFHHPEYGVLHFTRKLLGEVKRHFDAEVRGIGIAIDADHGSTSGDTSAEGWIEQMQFRDATGDKPAGLWAYVRWTPQGVQHISDEIYRYFSPEYGNHLDELTGDKIKNVAFGGGLTNRPFLKIMPAVQLSQKGTNMGSKAATKKAMGDDKDIRDMADDETEEYADDEQDSEEYAEDDLEDEEDGGDDEDEEEDVPPAKGRPGKGKFAPRNFQKGGKKMSEKPLAKMTRAELMAFAERTVVLEHKVRQREAAEQVSRTLSEWNAGRFVFSEKPRRMPESVATSKVFDDAYQAMCFSDDFQQLGEKTQRQVQRTIELALAQGMVRTDALANSSELQAPRQTRRVSKRSSDEDQEIALMEAAEEEARAAGKQFSQFEDLPHAEQMQFMERAARLIGYGKR